MKDLREGYSSIEVSGLAMVFGDNIPAHHHLHRKDVLFVAKGSNNHALVFDHDLPKAVAASAFFVLQPDLSKVDPHYLAWWINQPPVQEYLQQNMAGSYVPNITRPTVENITVPLPSLAHQRLIAAVYDLAKVEQRLMGEIAIERRRLVDHFLTSSINTSEQ